MLGHIHNSTMKYIILSLLASLLILGCPIHADEVKGMINFENVPVTKVLSIYKSLSGLELVLDSRAKRIDSPITLKATIPLSHAETTNLIEKTLLKQAGIVITLLDDKRASVTYNDALPTTR